MKIIPIALTVFTLLSTSSAVAGGCGNGKIIQIKEGGWNTNDLMIMIDYSQGDGAAGHKNTNFETNWIRYRSSLDVERLRAIRSLAYLAYSSGLNIQTYSQTSQCNAATEITLY